MVVLTFAPTGLFVACGEIAQPTDSGVSPDVASQADRFAGAEATANDVQADSPRDVATIYCNRYVGPVDAGYEGMGPTSECPPGWSCSWCQCQWNWFACRPPDM